ncbi:MAG: flavodoxin family protein [Thermoanaerobacteraceae bacterium]|nr:flavodoxin family protein [Thermoanaerobacteraceae bacterium]
MVVRILGVSGSPRAKGATQLAVRTALEAASELPGVTTEFLDLRGKDIHYCIHCDKCLRQGTAHCVAFKDDMNEHVYESILAADGLILGSPVYHMGTSPLTKLFMNRFRPLGRLFGQGHWSTKVGGAIAVGGVRNGGQETTLGEINNFFLANGMVVVSGGIFAYNGGAVWSNDQKEKGALSDEVGLATVRVLGRRVAAIAGVLKAGREASRLPTSALLGCADDDELQQRLHTFRRRSGEGE